MVFYTLILIFSPPDNASLYLHFPLSLPLMHYIDFECMCSFYSMSLGSVVSAPSSSQSFVLYSPSMVCLEVLLRDNAIRVQSRKDQGAALHIIEDLKKKCWIWFLLLNVAIRMKQKDKKNVQSIEMYVVYIFLFFF